MLGVFVGTTAVTVVRLGAIFGNSSETLAGRRHGVVTAAAKGMTTQQAPHGQPRAVPRTVLLQCLQCIVRTARLETASGMRTSERVEYNTQVALIKDNKALQQLSKQVI